MKMICEKCGGEMVYVMSHFIDHEALEIPGLGVRPAFSEFVPSGYECQRCSHVKAYHEFNFYQGVVDAS